MEIAGVFRFAGCLAATLILCTVGLGEPRTFQCPEKLPSVEQSLSAAPAGWQHGKQRLPLWLYSITLFDGPVEENVALAPDGRAKAGKFVTDTWSLDATSTRPLWLQCNYANTTITLEKPLGKGYRKCVARYNPQIHVAGQPVMEELRCE
jgi:hypothetical protein